MPSEPDRLIREIPLIERYSRHNEAEDWRFRAFVKGQLALSNKALDALVRETTEAVWKEIDCTTCGHCCRTLQIVVDGKDIARLAAHRNTTAREFQRQFVRTAEDKTRHFATTPCPFLSADNRCTVYEHRPQACRDFPYLHAENFRSRSLMMLDNLSLCPIVFNVWQRLKQQLARRGREKK